MPRDERTGMWELPQNPELADLLNLVARKVLLDLHSHTVATVTAYNPTEQTVDVRVDILRVVADHSQRPTAANPAPAAAQAPIPLRGIPVAWPRTNSAHLTFPLNPGDKGELHVQDRSLERYRELGEPTDPYAMWTHALQDSVFHPTRIDKPGKLATTDQTAAVLEGPLVKMGANAAEPVLKGTTVVQSVTAYAASIAAANTTLQAAPPTVVTLAAAIASINTATQALLATLGNWSSQKVLTE